MSFEYGAFLLGGSNESYVITRPMPRRVPCIASSFLTMPAEEKLRPWQSTSQHAVDLEVHHEIIGICVSKNAHGDDVSALGFSPPYFSGSPPRRARNPVVQDVKFCRDLKPCNQTPPLPPQPQPAPAPPPPGLSSPLPKTHRTSPCIRVEGFDCSGHVFEPCAGRDSRRHVSASA